MALYRAAGPLNGNVPPIWTDLAVTPGSNFCALVAVVTDATSAIPATRARNPNFKRILPSSSGRASTRAVLRRLSPLRRRDSTAPSPPPRNPDGDPVQQTGEPGRQEQHDEDDDDADDYWIVALSDERGALGDVGEERDEGRARCDAPDRAEAGDGSAQ